ncbi:sodium:solute symporter family transporter [Natrarchaeobius oligotrophus]|uniref:Sodium:solute symporter family protein n=1 Tax=Natrarchaeobius chitinivorans TaxID=1679083 RepID=A0A3N6MSZ2_NATCH|nr:hypothetical protein [Natrarchaeobius chitinivorans]RQG99461.1 hypothetical protein EA472_14660 [Natrarchaeobius chitinivorans]
MTQQVLLAVGVGTMLLGITVLSLLTKKWIGSSGDYILAGREVSASLLACGVLAFGFATDISVLFAIFAIVYGFFPAMSMGIVYVAWIVYGLILVKMVRNVGTSTITEWYEMRFDYPTRAAISISQLFGVIFIISAGSLGAAAILNGYAGWPIVPTVILLLAVVGLVVLFGGLWGVTISNIVLTVYGLVIFPAVLVYLMVFVGGFDWLVANVPADAHGFSFPGGWDFSSLGETSYITWGVMWFVALVYGTTYYWTRAGSARSDKVARDGYVIAGILGLLLMTIVMPLLAMYAFALAPEAYVVAGGEVPPEGAYGVLATSIPLALGVLIPIGFVAASISTYTTDVIASAALVLRDFYQRFVAPEADPEELLMPSRVISVLVIVVAFIFTLILDVQGLVELFLTMLGISSVIILIDMHWKVMTSRSAFLAAVAGILGVLGWTFSGLAASTGIHQVWIALGLTVGIGVLGGLVTSNKYYAEDGWEVVPSSEAVERADDVELADEQLEILESIATGGTRFADFLDTLRLPSNEVNDFVEELDRARYIHRKGMRSHDFYDFELTERGKRALVDAQVVDTDEAFTEFQVNEEMESVIRIVNDEPGIIVDDISNRMSKPNSDVVPIIQRLLQLEYIDGSGWIRQKHQLTAAGEAALEELESGSRSAEQQVEGANE